jgi:hypothetical protein
MLAVVPADATGGRESQTVSVSGRSECRHDTDCRTVCASDEIGAGKNLQELSAGQSRHNRHDARDTPESGWAGVMAARVPFWLTELEGVS